MFHQYLNRGIGIAGYRRIFDLTVFVQFISQFGDLVSTHGYAYETALATCIGDSYLALQ